MAEDNPQCDSLLSSILEVDEESQQSQEEEEKQERLPDMVYLDHANGLIQPETGPVHELADIEPIVPLGRDNERLALIREEDQPQQMANGDGIPEFADSDLSEQSFDAEDMQEAAPNLPMMLRMMSDESLSATRQVCL